MAIVHTGFFNNAGAHTMTVLNNTFDQPFDDLTAVVTGGSSGIGLATAKALLAQGARRVYITGRDGDRLASAAHALGERAVAVQCEVAKVAELARLTAAVEANGERIDVLFANAGVAHNNTLGATTQADFDALFDTNVRGVFFTVQALLPLLVDGASVVLNASVAGLKGMPNLSVYSASKAAVRSFARTWASDLKPRGIRVNVISPGVTRTPILSGGLGMNEQAIAGTEAYLAAAAPSGRMADAGEIASAVLFLASPAASYVNGVELCVDGGLAQV
jgi:NAD(P)-dependent dehydrogenase (short-subunit alcohol dehydrogenase family)